MRLSETPAGEEWLLQFEYNDRLTARRLLDDVVVVTNDTLAAGLRSVLGAITNEVRQAVAFYPVWEVAKDKSGESVVESLFPLDVPPTTAPTARMRPAARKIPQPTLGISGSVGSAIHLVAEVCKTSSRLLDRPSLEVLRRTKCGRVVLVDDVVGSGDRVCAFLRAFYMHPTIKSWCSYHKLRITVVCYASSSAGRVRIERSRREAGQTMPPAVDVRDVCAIGRGGPLWTPGQRAEMETLCRRYAGRTGHRAIPMGYGNAMNLIVLPYAIPNTAPPILWSRAQRWRPLFPNRAVPPALLSVFPKVARDPIGADLEETLRRIGQLRLARRDWSKYASPAYRRLIMLLALHARGVRDAERIAGAMNVNVEVYDEVLNRCMILKLISADGRMTAGGLAELRYARAVGKRWWELPVLDETIMYFPQSLRGGQGST